MKKLFRTKPMNQLANQNSQLRRCLSAFDLTMLGIGAIIGAGIFVLTGIAAATQAGPAVIFSFILAAVACSFAALSYAELASSFGGCGGAYGYAYAGIGEFIAWLVGWDLILEYGMDASTVSIGWSGYFQSTLHAMGITLPKIITTDPMHGGLVNLPAMLIILCLAGILSINIKSSSRFNTLMVYIKLIVIALFLGIGVFHFDPQNWHPFMPFGAHGIVNGAGFVFFAYIGFDSISTAGEETIDPQRDLPVGIIASLLICTLVYVLVAVTLTGIAYYPTLNVTSPVSTALVNVGYRFIAEIIAFGAMAGLIAGIFAMYFGLSRVYLAMSRDGLLPTFLTKIDPKSQTPRQLIWAIGLIMALFAGFFPINQIANLVNIGTLAAFVGVCTSVIVLRYTKPHLHRPFKTPFVPLVPFIGIVLCFYLMVTLPVTTWISFGLWTGAGLVIYLFFSKHNSVLEKNVVFSQ